MSKHSLTLLAIAAIFCIFSSSCASIVSKSSYPISINSNPLGAEILIKDKKGLDVYKGVTPATVKLDASNSYMRGERYEITFKATGYAEQTIYIHSKLNGWYWGNILFGGVIGMLIVDPITGAMYKLDDTPINVTLPKASSEAGATLNIIDINSIPEDMKKDLVQIN